MTDQQNKEFWKLVNANERIIYFAMNRYKMTSEDVKHDIMLAAWQSYNTYAGKAPFHIWLYKIAMNTLFSKIRRKYVHTRAMSAYVDRLLAEDQADNIPDSWVTYFRKGFGKLSNQEQEIIVLAKLKKIGYIETAALVGLTPNHCRVLVDRAKDKIFKHSGYKNRKYFEL